MNGYFKQVTPPKAISNLESGKYLLNKLTEFKKNGCKIFVIEYYPIDNRRMAPVWDLFIDLGDMECILGIRVKVQVIPSPGDRDLSSITKQHRYCKHHVNYSSKVWYIQYKTVINLDHPVTLAMTEGSRLPCSVSTLCQEYFDLKSSDDGTIIHGVFVCIESATRGPSVDTTYMVSNKEAKSILTKITHCPSAWWYWHWVEKGYTQGTIRSLLNSFESDTADNAHNSTYDPSSVTVTSMFAGDNDNQWLDQVEEEFRSDLSDHNEDNINNSGTTIEMDKGAKASLAKEMKGKDYDLEGIESRSSKQTHRTNMTGKTGMTSNRSVTTKKFALDFSQQQKDLNVEQKRTAALEQRLREMESALSAGGFSMPLQPNDTIPPQSKSISIFGLSTKTDITFSQKFNQLNLPPTHNDPPAKGRSGSMADVGRWS